jgi:hypothetical protein
MYENCRMRAALGLVVSRGLVKTVVLRRTGSYGLTLHVLILSITTEVIIFIPQD